MSVEVRKQTAVPSLQNKASQEAPVKINYKSLEALCNIEGLQDSNTPQTTTEAHKMFIKFYPEIFQKKKPKQTRIPIKDVKRIIKKKITEHTEEYHNIGAYLRSAHLRKNTVGKSDLSKSEMIIFMQILNKLPLNRSLSEKEIAWKSMKLLPDVTAVLSDQEVKDLSIFGVVLFYEKGTTVYGNLAFHVILKGSVKPVKKPSRSVIVEPVFLSRYSIPYRETSALVMKEGSCFGTLEEMPESEVNSNVQCFITLEDCEILQLSAQAYTRIRKITEKINNNAKRELICSCIYYQLLPDQLLDKLASCIEWKQYPPDSVLVNEGEINEFVGYIKSGRCNVLKNIYAIKQKPFEKVVERIVLSSLREKESFGELSILKNLPSSCTIIAATNVELGIIRASILKELDNISQTFLFRTAEKNKYDQFNQDEINKTYVFQEKEREWEDTKRTVMEDIYRSVGITPGIGKRGPYWDRRKPNQKIQHV